MEQIIAKCIASLLYEEESLLLPGIGRIHSSYKETNIDQAQGVLHPPGKSLKIEASDEKDDNVLVKKVAETQKTTQKKAREWVYEYIVQVKEALANQEIISIPNVGRIYRNFEGELTLMQDKANFNIDSFGLPDIQFYPVSRQLEVEELAESSKVSQKKSAVVKEKAKQSKVKGTFSLAGMLPVLLTVLALIVVGIFYLNWYDDQPSALKIPVEERLNKKPGIELDTTSITKNYTPAEAEVIDEDEINTSLPTTDEDSEDKNEITLPEEPEIISDNVTNETVTAKYRECIIIIGSLSSQTNVDKLVARIRSAEMTPYTADSNGNTRVGVVFNCLGEESDNMLVKVRETFDQNAWFLKN